jgi:carbonic anhydrase
MKVLSRAARMAAAVFVLAAGQLAFAEEATDPAETGYQADTGTTWRKEGAHYFEHLPAVDGEVCDSSRTQSPIRVDAGSTTQANELTFDYRPYNPDSGNQFLLNNGHTLQWYWDPDEYVDIAGKQNLYALNPFRGADKLSAQDERSITLGGKKYKLLQMHVHHPSEHVVDGKRYPLEAHFVHQAADTRKLVVVAVLLESQPATETWYQWLEWSAGINTLDDYSAGTARVFSRRYNPGAMLPPAGSDGKRAYLRYDGSLTTRPCSDGVTWIVLTTPFKVGQAGIDAFKGTFGVNARPLQPLNDRVITKSQ